jgi:hypothetical protein
VRCPEQGAPPYGGGTGIGAPSTATTQGRNRLRHRATPANHVPSQRRQRPTASEPFSASRTKPVVLLQALGRIFGSPVGTSWDGGQRPRSLSNGCGHWPGPSLAGRLCPGAAARQAHRARQARQPRIRAGRLDRCPSGPGRFRPASASLQPGMRYSPERMARRCEALSPDIPGGLQCLAFTPERCSKRRLCRRHC